MKSESKSERFSSSSLNSVIKLEDFHQRRRNTQTYKLIIPREICLKNTETSRLTDRTVRSSPLQCVPSHVTASFDLFICSLLEMNRSPTSLICIWWCCLAVKTLITEMFLTKQLLFVTHFYCRMEEKLQIWLRKKLCCLLNTNQESDGRKCRRTWSSDSSKTSTGNIAHAVTSLVYTSANGCRASV